jgi:hypothetical protein
VPGHTFTSDGKAPHAPSPSDHFPDKVSNLVSLHLSMGAYNSLQQSDTHNYWEFNYTTNWIHPLYELPFTGGADNQYANGQISLRQSIVPGNSPGDNNRGTKLAVMFGDNPDLPRDPDRFDADDDSQRVPPALHPQRHRARGAAQRVRAARVVRAGRQGPDHAPARRLQGRGRARRPQPRRHRVGRRGRSGLARHDLPGHR